MSLASVDRNAGSRHFKPLDGIRGIAILLVLVHHSFRCSSNNLLPRGVQFVADAGWLGVVLFFVLSGFLIGGILMDSVGSPRWYQGFLARRSLRIFPLYFAFLLIYFLVLPLWPYAATHLPRPHGIDAATFWIYISNMREFVVGQPTYAPGVAPMWSLGVEEQAYLLLPLLIWICPFRWLGVALTCVFVSSVGWKIGTAYMHQSVELRYEWVPACLDAFAAGALVAWLSRNPHWRSKTFQLAKIMLIISAAVAAMTAIRCGTLLFWKNPRIVLTFGSSIFAILFSSWIALSVLGNERSPMNRLLSARLLRRCGMYSYAAYLFHATIIELLRPQFGAAETDWNIQSPVRAALLTVLVIAISFAAACISWELLEKHFVALKRFFPGASHVVRSSN